MYINFHSIISIYKTLYDYAHLCTVSHTASVIFQNIFDIFFWYIYKHKIIRFTNIFILINGRWIIYRNLPNILSRNVFVALPRELEELDTFECGIIAWIG
jgi:hypothetical protein